MVGVKFYADGALGSRGAWLKQPYADKPDTRGLRSHTDAELLARWPSAAAARGFQIATHAIGDAANAQVISTYERPVEEIRPRPALADRAFPDRRPDGHPAARAGRDHRLDAADPPDQRPADGREARLGPNRLAGAYAWQIDARERCTAGVRLRLSGRIAQPLPGLAAAISRQDMNGAAAGRLASARSGSASPRRSQAFTRGAAYAGFAEQKIGSARAGQMGRLHPRRPRSDQGRCAGARPNAGAGDLGRRQESLGSAASAGAERGK